MNTSDLNESTQFQETEIGLIPKAWKASAIGEHIDLITGFPFKSNLFLENNECNCVRLLRGINVTENRLRWDLEKTRFWLNPTDDISKYFVEINDLIISMDGSKVGRNYALVQDSDIPSLLVQRVARIRSNNTTLVNNYLHQIIGSDIFIKYVDSVKTSSGIPHISAKQIKDFKIPLPPLAEQIRIGECLSKMDERIRVVEEQIETVEKLKKGLMQQLLTRGIGHTEFVDHPEFGSIPKAWKISNIGENTDLITGFPFKSNLFRENEDNCNIRLLRGINVTENRIRWDFEKTKYWSNPIADLLKYYVEVGDLIISMDGSKVGRNYAVIIQEDIPSLLVQRVARIRSNGTSLINEFLHQIIGSELFINYVDSVKTSSGIPHISAKQIREFKIPLPPLSEQVKIGKILKNLGAKRSNLSTKKDSLVLLKSALMNDLLTGRKRLLEVR